MSAFDFDSLSVHAGHEIECVLYGTDEEAINAAVECLTCGSVILDYDKYQDETED